jgi:kumamolisin
MASVKTRTIIDGSEKSILRRAKPIGRVDPEQRIEITVLLRPKTRLLPKALAKRVMQLGGKLPAQRKYLSREDLAGLHGADPADVAAVEAFALKHNLTIVQAHLGHRTVRLAGKIVDLTKAFRPNLKKYRVGKRVFRGRTGSLSVPGPLAKIVVGVFGFDNRPVAKPHCRRRSGDQTGNTAKRATNSSFTPPQVGKLYNFPHGLDGTGQCIALIELNDTDAKGKVTGTGYNAADLSTYFKALRLPMPQVAAIGVHGGDNAPGLDPKADGEVMLDIEVAGALAPGASIVAYFSPNTDQGFLDAVHAAVHDTVHKPSVISISWGGAEDSWTAQFRNAFNQAFQDAALIGVTICCSSGDDGSADLPAADRDGHPHVDFPSSSPFALSCGGTKLVGSGNAISSEVAWNEGNQSGAGGGGVSNCFARPPYQVRAKVPRSPKGKAGRGVPDVAGDADPETGYEVRVSEHNTVIGGTSAVAPLWAGLIARINERLAAQGKPTAGFINPLLYKSPGTLHDVVDGNNDIDGTLHKYTAGPGWDACTGLGSPNGTEVMRTLGG